MCLIIIPETISIREHPSNLRVREGLSQNADAAIIYMQNVLNFSESVLTDHKKRPIDGK